MKNLTEPNIARWRIAKNGDAELAMRNNPEIAEVSGVFMLVVSGAKLMVVASNGDGWDHVSVSHRSRTPSWEEMCRVKELFFHPDEVAVQYHPAATNYVNIHSHCLHLWRPHDGQVPMPPIEFV